MSNREFKVPVPAVKGYFGDRLVTYTIQCTPQHLFALLGHDPRSTKRKQLKQTDPALAKIYDTIQRPTSKGRKDSVAAYVADRMAPGASAIGAFPALSIGCTHPEDFEPTTPESSSGTLYLETALGALRRVLLDGLGRFTGTWEHIEAGHPELLNFTFPVTIYTPRQGTLSIDDLGQLFADFNGRVHPVPARFSLRLETVDPYVRLARDLYEQPFLQEHGGVAEGAASLGNKSTELVVQTVLVRAVRGACEGRVFQDGGGDAPEDANLTTASYDEMRDRIAEFFNSLALAMGDARWQERDSIHLTSPGWQALGIICRDVMFDCRVDDPIKAVRKIAAIDWSRYNPEWLDIGLGDAEMDKTTGAVITDDKGRKRVALTNRGRTSIDLIIAHVRSRLGIDAVEAAAA